MQSSVLDTDFGGQGPSLSLSPNTGKCIWKTLLILVLQIRVSFGSYSNLHVSNGKYIFFVVRAFLFLRSKYYTLLTIFVLLVRIIQTICGQF
jgi:hypothetical protein